MTGPPPRVRVHAIGDGDVIGKDGKVPSGTRS